MRRAATLALTMLLGASPGLAQDEATSPGDAASPPAAAGTTPAAVPLPSITAALDTTATTVGGRLRLTVDVEGDAGWQITPPERSPEMGPFRVRGVEEAGRSEGHRTLVYTLVATEAGDVEVPSLAFTVQRGEDDPVQVATTPLPVRVSSNLTPTASPAPGDAAAGETAPGDPAATSTGPATGSAPGPPTEPAPADLKPAREAPRDWRPVWIAAIVAVLAGIAGFFLFRALRKLRGRPAAAEPERRIKAPTRPAWEIALEELDAIATADWVGQGEVRRQYDEVTEALRRYVENRYGIPALECTTDDLREMLRRSAMPGEAAGRTLSLLAEADLVKFAKGIPDPVDARSGTERARAVVEDTIPAPEVREAAA
jgi:hypothetical protein